MRIASLTIVALLSMVLAAPAAAAADGGPPRPYQPTGTRVEGTPGLRNGPLLTPGQYQDSIKPGEVRYYSIQLDRGTPYVAVTMARPATSKASSSDVLEATMVNAQGDSCNSPDRVSPPYRGVVPLTAVAGTGAVGTAGEAGRCSKPGRYYVAVKRTDDAQSDPAPQPLELLYLLEPALADPTEPVAQAEVPLGPVTTALPIKELRASGSFADAPSLAAGVYRDTIRPGETVFYRVPLGWGQRMEYDVSLAASQAYPSSLSVKSTIFNPYRGDMSDDSGSLYRDTVTLRLNTPTIDYAKRKLSSVAETRARLAGYYYISVHVTPQQDTPVGAAELPLTLSVNIFGAQQSGPRYANGETVGIPAPTSTDEALRNSEDSQSSTLTIIGIGLTAAAVAFGVGAVLLARRYAARAVAERSGR